MNTIRTGTVTSADGTVIGFDLSGAGPAVILVQGALMNRSDRAGSYPGPGSRTPKPVAASFSKTCPGARRSATLAALSSSSWASRAA